MLRQNPMLRFSAIAITIAALFIALLSFAQTVSAFPSGFTGHSGNPAVNGGATCSDCHQGGERPAVVLIGPTEVAPGSTHQYSLRITGGPAQAAGFNVSVTNGMLASGNNSQLREGEVTHTSPMPFSGSSASFNFSWTAPMEGGTVVMYGAGNSTNGDDKTSSDGVGTASISIRVQSAAPQPPTTRPPVPDPPTSTRPPVPSSECQIPASGPWPPCATNGNTANTNNGNNGSCQIPASGPWPPCATNGGSTNPGNTNNNNNNGCVIPASGPWPACATNGNTNTNANSGNNGCVIPTSGPWPACARFRVNMR